MSFSPFIFFVCLIMPSFAFAQSWQVSAASRYPAQSFASNLCNKESLCYLSLNIGKNDSKPDHIQIILEFFDDRVNVQFMHHQEILSLSAYKKEITFTHFFDEAKDSDISAKLYDLSSMEQDIYRDLRRNLVQRNLPLVGDIKIVFQEQ